MRSNCAVLIDVDDRAPREVLHRLACAQSWQIAHDADLLGIPYLRS